MKKYLDIAKIVSVHGLRGEVNAQVLGDSSSQLRGIKRLYSESGNRVYEVERCRPKGEAMAIIKIKGADTPEAAEALRNTVLFADRDDLSLPSGTYFIADLLGMEVFDEAENSYGVITDVLRTGANDVYEITNGGKKYYIPAVPAVVLKTEPEAARMTVFPMEGLFDEN